MPDEIIDVFPKILVAGVGPIPPEAPEKLFAPGLRVWGIARELANHGHSVLLICGEFGQTSDQAKAKGYLLEPSHAVAQGETSSSKAQSVDLELRNNNWAELIANEADVFDADAAVGTTDVMNHALASSKLNIPMWMDYFGDPMAERQMLAFCQQSDKNLIDQWNMMAPALARADRISGCSSEQVGALFGQMSVVGRLGQFTAEEILVHKVPPWIEPIELYHRSKRPGNKTIVRGRHCPEDAVLVIQTGGFNTWLDVKNLFKSLEFAMASNPKLHFASTGGAIPGHHEGGYEFFTKLLEKSAHRDRYHLMGWIPMKDVPVFISEADIGLNVDLEIVEGRLGTRNRLLDWLAGGLAVVSTPGCELARAIGREGHLTLVPHNEPFETAKGILKLTTDMDKLKSSGVRTSEYVREEYSASKCLQPLLKWARRPKQASDLRTWKKGKAMPSQLYDKAISARPPLRKDRSVEQRLAWLELRRNRVEGSRLVKFAMKLRGPKDLDNEPDSPKKP
jgi:hypothetical protein